MCNVSDEQQPVSHGGFTPEMTNAHPHATGEAFQEASSLFPDARSDATAAVRPEVRERVNTIPVEIDVVIGRAKISVAELMRADPGYSFRLDKRFGEPVELLVNGRLFGYGEIVSDKYENVIGIRMIRVAR
ncbi:hypothetical protein B5M44_26330 [Shinella sumterensis]|nr:FliM/FliN family flagellar motor switch protein [Shinella sumterensis]MCD1265322.1 hypothetical protein [Shinella sumterensis]TFE92282.1 hypothetical protein B5M44_26330 [Shinella sumterensis]